MSRFRRALDRQSACMPCCLGPATNDSTTTTHTCGPDFSVFSTLFVNQHGSVFPCFCSFFHVFFFFVWFLCLCLSVSVCACPSVSVSASVLVRFSPVSCPHPVSCPVLVESFFSVCLSRHLSVHLSHKCQDPTQGEPCLRRANRAKLCFFAMWTSKSLRRKTHRTIKKLMFFESCKRKTKKTLVLFES